MGIAFPRSGESFDGLVESFVGAEPGSQIFNDALVTLADNVSGQVQDLIDTSDECDCGRTYEEPLSVSFTTLLDGDSSLDTSWGVLSNRTGEYGEQALMVTVTIEVTVADQIEEPDCVVEDMPTY